MIRLFDRDETNFDHNETPLPDVISAIVELESNGMYELVLECPRNDFAKTLTAGKVLKADTPKGEQLFRIYKPIKNLKTYTIYARHVFYDLAKNFIENVRPTNATGNSAIQTILSGATVEHGFSGSSDIAGLNTANYVRMSPIQALLGADNAFLKVWGGELTRDNFTFRIDAQGGQDRGYEIRLGKNLIGIEADVDETNVYTCVYPTVVIDGNTVTTLPEKYIYSPLVDNYESTYVIEERIELSDEEKELPLEAIYTLMRERVALLFEQGVDKPEVNYKVDFVELSKTEQYKDLQILEQLDMYDTVHAIVDELDIRVNAKVIKYAYDSLRKRFVSMELGNFKQNLASQTKNTLGMVEKQISQSANLIREAFERSNDLITGNRGGHVVMRRNAEGLPYEILIMDTDDIQTAQNVIRMNQQGIGFSETGYNGPFGVAITIDGNLNAEIMNVFNVNADNIVGNTSEFVRSAWNSATGGNVSATGDGVVSNASNGSQTLLQNGVLLVRGTDGSSIGYIGFSQEENNNNFTLTTASGRSLLIRHSNGDGTFTPLIDYLEYRDRLYFGKRATFQDEMSLHGDLDMNQYDINRVRRVGAGILETTSIGTVLSDSDNTIVVKGVSGAKIGVGGQGSGGFTPIIAVDSSRAYIYKTLSMEGNDITNQSDERLKENIADADYDGVELFRTIEPKNFTWKNKERFGSQTELGFIAQQLALIDPEIVTQTPDDDTPDGVAWAINETQMNRRAWIALHQLVKENDTLKQELADLKAILSEKGLI